MKYIYNDPDWPSFRWDKDLVSTKLGEVLKSAGYLAGRLSTIGFDDRMSAAVDALADNVSASSAIEGVELNGGQLRSSVARRLGVSLPDAPEPSHYIDGVVEMTMDAIANYKAPLTHERLFGWHNCLFPTGRSGQLLIDVARYRSGEMKVISGMFGRERVHYEAPAAAAVEAEMSRFIGWFNSSTMNGYLKSAVAHLWFLCIHPFDDGNGRIGRAIADMALSQAEDSGLRFFSMSGQIDREKKHYYDILERTQKGSCEITPWMAWYLECLNRGIRQSDELLSQVLRKAVFWQTHAGLSISERQRNVLNIYLDGYQGKLTVKNWAKHARVSPDTAARDISSLEGMGILRPVPGSRRNVEYVIV